MFNAVDSYCDCNSEKAMIDSLIVNVEVFSLVTTTEPQKIQAGSFVAVLMESI
jgi:hypothetical protein